MTDREAIVKLEEFFEWLGGISECTGCDDSIAVALSALKEREERARGCEFCKGINEPMQFYEYGSDDRGILFDEIKTFYCPRCGRPLKGAQDD